MIIVFITTKEQEKLLQEILDNVDFPWNFGVYGETDEIDCDLDIISSMNDCYEGFYSLNGASKYVLLNDTLPFVIKVPFNGYWEEDYNEETDEYTGEFSFVDFEGSHFSPHNNYCAGETIIYDMMCKYAFDMFFAETKFFKKIDETPIYIQEKVIPYSSDKSKNFRSIKTSKLAEKLASRTYINFPEAWIEAAICHYGKELTEAFIVYLSSDDDVAEIIREDLHSSNFGYRENGEPCILDYSGYNC